MVNSSSRRAIGELNGGISFGDGALGAIFQRLARTPLMLCAGRLPDAHTVEIMYRRHTPWVVSVQAEGVNANPA